MNYSISYHEYGESFLKDGIPLSSEEVLEEINQIVDLNKKVDKLEKENQALRELVEICIKSERGENVYLPVPDLADYLEEKLKEITGK